MAEGERKDLAPGQVGVKQIPTDSLEPNPHNPRMLFDKEPLGVLRASIDKVGILVPLTVYWSARRKTYVILDGQRRWLCAKELKKSSVPVNEVAEPTTVQNIVTMFQIHKLREDWELMPTALKLEVLMKELDERGDKALAELTGLDQAVVVRCKKLLSYSRDHQDLMLAAEPSDRVKADFFIELHAIVTDRTVKAMQWYKRDYFISRMLQKYQERNGLKAVTDFRTMKQYISNAVKAKRAALMSRRLELFTKQDDLALDFLELPGASSRAEARKLVRMATALSEKLRGLETDTFYGEEALWKELEGLLVAIRRVLADVGRRAK